MAVLSVWSIHRPDRQISRQVSAELFRTIQARPADRLRHRLSMAVERNQPAALDQAALGNCTHQRTFWLGTIRALALAPALDFSGAPLKNRHAAKIAMSSTTAVSKSMCLGS